MKRLEDEAIEKQKYIEVSKDFINSSIAKFISKYGYDNFDVSLPIDFQSIVQSTINKDHLYGLYIKESVLENGKFIELYMDDKVIANLKFDIDEAGKISWVRKSFMK